MLVFLTLFAASAALILAAPFLSDEARAALLQEHGILETPSAILPLMTAALFLHRFPKNFTTLAASFFLSLFAYRELGLDWHKSFFMMSVFKPRDYWDPAFPLSEKIAAAFLFAALLSMLAALFWRGAPSLWRRWRRGESAPFWIVAGLLALLIAQGAESLHKRLGEEDVLFFAAEEVLELAGQCLFFLSALLARRGWTGHGG